MTTKYIVHWFELQQQIIKATSAQDAYKKVVPLLTIREGAGENAPSDFIHSVVSSTHVGTLYTPPPFGGGTPGTPTLPSFEVVEAQAA